MSVTFQIDGQPLAVEAGTTILDAAARAGVEIPTLCHVPGIDAAVSCMVCVVRDQRDGRLVPACSTVVRGGEDYDTSSPEVGQARRMAVQLVLDRHGGDCVAPCELACPCQIPMPKVLRALREGRADAAHQLVAERCALPRCAARACPAFCENACRRKGIDHAVGLCELHRLAADATASPLSPTPAPSPWNIALEDSSAAALGCAHRLAMLGHRVTVASSPNPGDLPSEAFDADVEELGRMGIQFEPDSGTLVPSQFDALLGVGDFPAHQEKHTLVRSLAAGRDTADRLLLRLAGLPEVIAPRRSCRAGKMSSEELAALCPETEDERGEAWRCLHCDCRSVDDCRLRQVADALGAWRVPSPPRPPIAPDYSHATLVHEPNKCIACGACLRIARKACEPVGLSWHGRGAEIRVAPPLGKAWEQALTHSAADCVQACPTAALAWKDG